jgi:uncharacterized protein YjbI with pentapeptide repeats
MLIYPILHLKEIVLRDCDFLNASLTNSKFYGSEIKANSFVNTSLVDAVLDSK